MIDALLGTIAPHYCCGCQKIGTLLCDNCKYDIIDEADYRCLLCLGPSVSGICKRHKATYQKAWFVGKRQDTLQRLIGGFKFQNTQAAANKLAELLHSTLPDFPSNTVIIPIPTVASHIRERGYDHMFLIARQFAKLRKLPLNASLLVRKNTQTQHTLNRHDRTIQAAHAFELQGAIDATVNYLILDDIVTTGSTIKAASNILTKAGATTVWVGAIARQPLD